MQILNTTYYDTDAIQKVVKASINLILSSPHPYSRASSMSVDPIDKIVVKYNPRADPSATYNYHDSSLKITVPRRNNWDIGAMDMLAAQQDMTLPVICSEMLLRTVARALSYYIGYQLREKQFGSLTAGLPRVAFNKKTDKAVASRLKHDALKQRVARMQRGRRSAASSLACAKEDVVYYQRELAEAEEAITKAVAALKAFEEQE